MAADPQSVSGGFLPEDEISTRDTRMEHGQSAPTWLEPPFPVGRYFAIEKIGRGGAGVVFRARDPELAREIAIKIVVPRSGGDRTRHRLLGEAQAIARLSHPNVVSVFDVGELAMGEGAAPGIYMVMELLEGVSLREWLREPVHGLPAIIDVMLAAGRGLEAAHRAGLVHRDFKPDNVLVGPGGRVHVLDFGLAQTDSPPSAETSATAEPHAFVVSGTPAYMAPEQHAGAPNDARTDLFAFCATFWEAVHGVQPYRGRTLDELEKSKARGCPAPPNRRAPRWLHEAIARGLAVDPERRPASMTSLLDEIERRRHRRRNVAVVAVAVGIVGGAYAIARTGGADARACVEQSERSLASAWNDDARELGRARFASIDLPYAADTWAHVQSVLDDRANAWRNARSQACESALGGDATAVEQAATALACLNDQLDELRARAEVFAVADRDIVRQAGRMAERMSRPERCLDAAWVAAEKSSFGGELEAELLRVRLQLELGHYDVAVAGAGAVAEAAAAVDDHRRVARALLLACRSSARRRSSPDRKGVCDDAWVAAERAGATGVAIAAMLQLAGQARSDDPEYAERLHRLVRARLDAMPPDERDSGLEADLTLSIAQRRREAGRWSEARVEAQRSYDISVASRGATDPAVVPALNELALDAEELGEVEHARKLFEQASKILLDARGSSHPDVLSVENNVAGLEITLGRHEAALERLERVLAAKRALEGDRSPWLLTTMFQQVEALTRLGRGAPARATAHAALALAEDLHGPQSPELIAPLIALVWALRTDGRCDEALGVIDRAAAIVDAAPVPDQENAAQIELERARCLDEVGREIDAGRHYARAIELAEALYGKDARRVAEALLARAKWERERGSRETAIELARRAAKICENSEGDPALTRAVETELATLR